MVCMMESDSDVDMSWVELVASDDGQHPRRPASPLSKVQSGQRKSSKKAKFHAVLNEQHASEKETTGESAGTEVVEDFDVPFISAQ